MSKKLFPSQELVEKLKALPTVTHQATEFRDMDAVQIAAILDESDEQTIIINDNKIEGDEQLKEIQAAAALCTKTVRLYSQISDNLKEQEDELLREILEELVVAPQHFYLFLERLWKAGQHHWKTEWELFVVNHDGAKEARQWAHTHHFSNIGEPEGDLWDAVKEMMYKFGENNLCEKLDALITLSEQHTFLTSGDAVMALLFAMLSNFVRGGVFYGVTNPSKTTYFPRLLAALSTGILFR